MKRKRRRKKLKPGERIKVRLPLAKKAGHPIGSPSGRKGYDRKRKKREIEGELEE
jgi:hypothetical protein